MDLSKITAVMSWPTPQTVKNLQHLLGFANFYQYLMQGFSGNYVPNIPAQEAG